MMEMVNNLQELVVGEMPNLLYFSSMFSNAILLGIVPPIAFALFGKRIPEMGQERYAACRLFFVGFTFAIVAIPLKTGYVVYDTTLLLMSFFVAAFLLFEDEEGQLADQRFVGYWDALPFTGASEVPVILFLNTIDPQGDDDIRKHNGSYPVPKMPVTNSG